MYQQETRLTPKYNQNISRRLIYNPIVELFWPSYLEVFDKSDADEYIRSGFRFTL